MDKLSLKISADWAYPTKPLGMSIWSYKKIIT